MFSRFPHVGFGPDPYRNYENTGYTGSDDFERPQPKLPIEKSQEDLDNFYHNCKFPKANTTNPKDLEGNKKPPISLVPPSVIIHLAQAFKEGAEKYGKYNWRKNKVQAMIYIDAAMRHILAKLDGEDIDPESGKDHIDGALASLAVYLDAQETGNLIDDRPTKGNAGSLIRKFGGKE